MTEPAFPPPPAAPSAPNDGRRTHAEYRWTGEKALAFLDALAACGKVAEAARAVGMSRQAAYRLKARAPRFADGWPLALAAGRARRKARGRRKMTVQASQGYGSGVAK